MKNVEKRERNREETLKKRFKSLLFKMTGRVKQREPNRTVQYITYHNSAEQIRREQISTVHNTTVQFSTVRYRTVQYGTEQYNTVQYSTVQYNTEQYSTVQQSGTKR